MPQHARAMLGLRHRLAGEWLEQEASTGAATSARSGTAVIIAYDGDAAGGPSDVAAISTGEKSRAASEGATTSDCDEEQVASEGVAISGCKKGESVKSQLDCLWCIVECTRRGEWEKPSAYAAISACGRGHVASGGATTNVCE